VRVSRAGNGTEKHDEHQLSNMESKIVIKLGGSVLRSAKELEDAIAIIRSYKRSVVIVVSAFQGITEKLRGAIDRACKSETFIPLFVEELRYFHLEMIQSRVGDEASSLKAELLLDARIKELTRYLRGIHYIGEVPAYTGDAALSYGERFSSLVLSTVLQNAGFNAKEVLPEDLGLLTDGEQGNASVDIPASEFSVSNKLAGDQYYVIPGFYGISQSGKATLLGRGGSDYSAAAIARCVNARYLDFWKDSEGFLSADPRLISDSVCINHLHYDEAAEIAYFGAKILHPRTVEPLRDKRIPVRIFSTSNIQSEKPVTIINDSFSVGNSILKSVTYSDDVCVLRLTGPGIGLRQGVLARATAKLDQAGINIRSVITAQTAINLLLARNDLPAAFKALNESAITTVEEVTALDDVSAIAVVGNGMIDKYGIAAKMFSAVAQKGINVELISFGASPVVTYFIVKKSDRNGAVKAIHEAFFSRTSKITTLQSSHVEVESLNVELLYNLP
jgi:aspartate kinase/aspartokinase/homoserine dehydrogenase 1